MKLLYDNFPKAKLAKAFTAKWPMEPALISIFCSVKLIKSLLLPLDTKPT